MSILNSILKTFVGDKTKQDLKKISPLVHKINAEQEQLKNLSDDALRNKTAEFKTQINTLRKPFEEAIAELKEEVDTSSGIDVKEGLYEKIDAQEEAAYQAVEELLNTLLPEAFAVVK